MAHETLFVPKQSDEVLIDCFCKIAEEYNIPSFNVTAFGFSTFDIHPPAGKSTGILKTLSP
jgi:hypothetical protein